MAAKIKIHPLHNRRASHSSRPKGVSDKAFEKVYWPFIPVLITICLLLSVAVRAVPISHLSGEVLGYQTTKSAQELLKDTNLQRVKAGETALSLNDELTKAAQAKADDMAKRDYWSHYTPQGVAPWSFVSATGYVYQSVGENLAAGFSDDDSVVNAWMASPHHRANILDTSYAQVGFGYANSSNYKAAGGGPMTVVVAFYAQPASATSPMSAPTNSDAGLTLGDRTSRAVAAISTGSLAAWIPLSLAIIGLVALGAFLEKHRRYVLNAASRGERYILRHPATDLGLLIIIGLVVLLAQTAGYIQ